MANNGKEHDKHTEMTNHPFESMESRREFYEQNIDKYKHAIDDQLSQLTSETKDRAKTGVIVIGAAAVSIWLISKLFSSSKSKKKASSTTSYNKDAANAKALYIQPPKENKMVEMIKAAIASFLLAIAKEKIANFIDNLNASNDGGTQLSNSSSKKTKTGV